MSIKVRFAFKAIAVDEESGMEHVNFEIAGSADAKAFIDINNDKPKKRGVAFAIVLPHGTPGQFNVIAGSQQGNALGYSFAHITDTQQLGEHLKDLGVSDDILKVWNQKTGEIVPILDNALERAAADLIEGVSGRKKPTGKGPRKGHE